MGRGTGINVKGREWKTRRRNKWQQNEKWREKKGEQRWKIFLIDEKGKMNGSYLEGKGEARGKVRETKGKGKGNKDIVNIWIYFGRDQKVRTSILNILILTYLHTYSNQIVALSSWILK